MTLLVAYGGVGTPEEAGYELDLPDGAKEGFAEPKKASLRELASDARLDEDRGFYDLRVFWLFTSETVGAKSMVFAVARWEPGGEHVLHWHPHGNEWFFVADGGGAHLIEEGEIGLDPGEAVYISAEEPHGFRSKLGTNTTSVYGYFGVGSLDQAGYEVPEEATGARSPPKISGPATADGRAHADGLFVSRRWHYIQEVHRVEDVN